MLPHFINPLFQKDDIKINMKEQWKEELYNIMMSSSEITEIEVKVENLISNLLTEQRKEVLSEVQVLVLKHPNTYEGEEELVFRTTLKEISTIIESLRIK